MWKVVENDWIWWYNDRRDKSRKNVFGSIFDHFGVILGDFRRILVNFSCVQWLPRASSAGRVPKNSPKVHLSRHELPICLSKINIGSLWHYCICTRTPNGGYFAPVVTFWLVWIDFERHNTIFEAGFDWVHQNPFNFHEFIGCPHLRKACQPWPTQAEEEGLWRYAAMRKVGKQCKTCEK